METELTGGGASTSFFDMNPLHDHDIKFTRDKKEYCITSEGTTLQPHQRQLLKAIIAADAPEILRISAEHKDAWSCQPNPMMCLARPLACQFGPTLRVLDEALFQNLIDAALRSGGQPTAPLDALALYCNLSHEDAWARWSKEIDYDFRPPIEQAASAGTCAFIAVVLAI